MRHDITEWRLRCRSSEVRAQRFLHAFKNKLVNEAINKYLQHVIDTYMASAAILNSRLSSHRLLRINIVWICLVRFISHHTLYEQVHVFIVNQRLLYIISHCISRTFLSSRVEHLKNVRLRWMTFRVKPK